MDRTDLGRIVNFKINLVGSLIKQGYSIVKAEIEEVKKDRLEITIAVRKEGYEIYQEYSIDLNFIDIRSVTAAIIEDINDRLKYSKIIK